MRRDDCRPNFFPMFPGHWLASENVNGMEPEEEGAYIHLLMLEFQDPTCSLPADETKLAGMSRLRDRWSAHRTAVLACFIPHPENGARIINPRLYSEWRAAKEEMERRSAQRSVAGQGNSAARKRETDSRLTETTPPSVEGRKEGRKENTPKAPKGAGERESLRADFDAFWRVWPRKVCKDAAEKAFAKAIKAAPLATILAGVEAGKRTDQWRKDGGQFIPHAATWLNGKRWMDEPEPEEREPFAAENDPDFVSDLLTFDPIVEAARKRATA